MLKVGVRDLKNQLSRYLEYVKKGERVVITEHGRVIAEINRPSSAQNNFALEQKFEQLRREGKMTLARRNMSLAPKPEITAAEKNFSWSSVLTEIQADRLYPEF